MRSEVWREQGRGFVRMSEKPAGYPLCEASLSSGKSVARQSDRKIGPIASMRMSRLCNLCIHSHDAMIRSAAGMKHYACRDIVISLGKYCIPRNDGRALLGLASACVRSKS